MNFVVMCSEKRLFQAEKISVSDTPSAEAVRVPSIQILTADAARSYFDFSVVIQDN